MDKNEIFFESTNSMNQKYQELIEVPNAVIFQLNLDCKYTAFNIEWTKLTDFTIDESLGTSFFTYIQEEDRTMIKEQFENLFKGHQDGIIKEFKLITKNGKLVEVHLFLRADLDQNGKILSFSGTLTELSSRKPNIEEFIGNINNFKLISENISDMVSVLAEDGLVLYASPSHTTILGMELDEYIGSYPIKHIHPDDIERMFHSFHQMVATWSTINIEYRCMHKNGEWLDLEMKGSPIKGPNGEIQVITISRDITSRKRAEEKLRQATMKFQTLIKSFPYGVKVEDENGNTTLSNEAYLNIFIQNKQIMKPGPLLLNEVNELLLDYDSYLQEKQAITENRESRHSEEIKLTNGRTIERDAIPLMEEGHFDGYLWIFRDVTDKKQAEQKLQEANQLLKVLSMQDGLTGIANRRCFDETLETAWNKRVGLSEPISLILLDIDFFKAFNDIYGHQAGDSCLKEVGSILRTISSDQRILSARYGGEEFVILLPGYTVNQAIDVAIQLQDTIEKAHIPHKGSQIKDILTVSMGISTKIATSMSKPSDMVVEADKALYEAKRDGRNQIRIFQ